MALLTPGDVFAETIPVDCGGDQIALYNPTVDDVAGLRAAFAKVIQDHCVPPYENVLQNDAVFQYWVDDLAPQLRDLMWKDYGMPDDDRAYRAALLRMTDDQVGKLPSVYMDTLGIESVLALVRQGGEDAVGNT